MGAWHIVGYVCLALLIVVVLITVDFAVPQAHFIHKTLLHMETGESYNLGNKLSSLFVKEVVVACQSTKLDKRAPATSIIGLLERSYSPNKRAAPYKITSVQALTGASFWETNHPVWKSVQPHVSSRLWAVAGEPLEMEVADLTVHLRCDDIPFMRGKGYNFMTSKVVREVLALIGTPIATMHIVTGVRCEKATNGRGAKCKEFVAAFAHGVKTTNPEIQITVVSQTVDKDFKTLMRAKRLIIGHSSFAFFAGLVCKGDVYAVSDGYFQSSVQMHDRWHWLHRDGLIVHHKDVKDYINQSDDVCALIAV